MNKASSVTVGVEPASRAVPARLVSLDAFRGMTMAAMVIVNNPGTWNAIYPPLRHAEWLGCTPTDLIFPFFLFIVGASMAFSLSPSPAADPPADVRIPGVLSPEKLAGASVDAVSIKTVLYEFLAARVGPAELASLVFALCTLAVWTAILLVLHRLRWHLKV